ncbi:MAG: hypothetical protein ACHQ3P_03635 [Candidatus Limnocylindrales bacterium]
MANKHGRSLAKLDRRLADGRLEVDRRRRQLDRAIADVAAIETRRAALLHEDGATTALAASTEAPTRPSSSGRPATRSRSRRSPRSDTAAGGNGSG